MTRKRNKGRIDQMVMQAPVKFTATHALQTRDPEYSGLIANRFFKEHLAEFFEKIGITTGAVVTYDITKLPNGSKFTYSLSGRIVGKASFEMRETFAGFKIAVEFEQIL